MKHKDFAAAGYILGWKLFRALPQELAYRIGELGADLAWRGQRGTEQLAKNLQRALHPAPVSPALVRQAMRSYARYWVEAFRLPSMASDPQLLAELDASIQGVEHLDQALDNGRGAIIVLSHSGNWDMAGVWLVHHAGTFTTVAEKLKPYALYEAFVDYRTKLGFEVLPHTSDSGSPMPTLEQRLRDGKIVCLLGERDLSHRGIIVDLLGQPAHLPTGAARLSQTTGAPILIADCYFTHGWQAHNGTRGWGMTIHPALTTTTIENTTQAIADALSETITAHPVDWHMLQPVFDADLDPHRRYRATNDATGTGE
ncbi:hypothetical protein CAQU_07120 [Corynebacterium aquilae DSM 44791]|uniref:Lipid A biosynthesis lauroyl acyltransferase n=1 Tax=Corynebacterium aquilae DSM 44791 TaxID=1431546 RepID=A0A1L7CGB1_9CORY|nr:hypothetical protein CAQU_07120 [Corynebacterium aquilae DSM 44791]